MENYVNIDSSLGFNGSHNMLSDVCIETSHVKSTLMQSRFDPSTNGINMKRYNETSEINEKSVSAEESDNLAATMIPLSIPIFSGRINHSSLRFAHSDISDDHNNFLNAKDFNLHPRIILASH